MNDAFPQLVDVYDNLDILAEGEKRFIVGVTKNEQHIHLLPLSGDLSKISGDYLFYKKMLLNMKKKSLNYSYVRLLIFAALIYE